MPIHLRQHGCGVGVEDGIGIVGVLIDPEPQIAVYHKGEGRKAIGDAANRALVRRVYPRIEGEIRQAIRRWPMPDEAEDDALVPAETM